MSMVVPRASTAQLRGVVTDATGRPLPGVLVEVWDYHQRLAGQGTDSFGRFYLRDSGTGARAILARAIGLVPVRRLLTPSDSVLTLVMQPQSIQVTAATVETEETACPRRDDSRARALWEHAASHYDDVMVAAPAANVSSLRFSAIVPVESLGVIDTTRLREYWQGVGYSPTAYRQRSDGARWFYAHHLVGVNSETFRLWRYRYLWSNDARHFADSAFGRFNRLALVESQQGDTVIAFCSRNRDWPYIKGVLHLASDSTFARAEWEFVTPEPREWAGGQALFAPINAGASKQPLLLVAGLFWRRLPINLYRASIYQEWLEFRRWQLCDGSWQCSADVRLK